MVQLRKIITKYFEHGAKLVPFIFDTSTDCWWLQLTGKRIFNMLKMFCTTFYVGITGNMYETEVASIKFR